jgi:hypothetical protein
MISIEYNHLISLSNVYKHARGIEPPKSEKGKRSQAIAKKVGISEN